MSYFIVPSREIASALRLSRSHGAAQTSFALQLLRLLGWLERRVASCKGLIRGPVVASRPWAKQRGYDQKVMIELVAIPNDE